MKLDRKQEYSLIECNECKQKVRSDRIEKHLKSRCERRVADCTFGDILPRTAVPKWLVKASYDHISQLFPLKDILENSCFYPASGFDASPIIIANGFIHSFVYADQTTERESYLIEIENKRFHGYKCILKRDINKHQLFKNQEQQDESIDAQDEFIYANGEQTHLQFAHWTIWEKIDGYAENIGPKLFSLLFISTGGMQLIDRLYAINGINIKMLAVIQPGGNWPYFFKADGPFWESIKKNKLNPEYLMTGLSFNLDSGEKTSNPIPGYEFLRRTKICSRFQRTTKVRHTVDIYKLS